MSFYNNPLRTVFQTIAQSDWNRKRLKNQYLNELIHTPFLYSSNHLTQLYEQSKEDKSISDLDTILYHLDHHDTYGIHSYDTLRNKVEKEIMSLQGEWDPNN